MQREYSDPDKLMKDKGIHTNQRPLRNPCRTRGGYWCFWSQPRFSCTQNHAKTGKLGADFVASPLGLHNDWIAWIIKGTEELISLNSFVPFIYFASHSLHLQIVQATQIAHVRGSVRRNSYLSQQSPVKHRTFAWRNVPENHTSHTNFPKKLNYPSWK
jgi:hypothetical protein